MKKLDVSVALAAFAFLCAAPSAAMHCTSHQVGAQGQHTRSRFVVVDGTGALCDFVDLGSAITYVTGKTRGSTLYIPPKHDKWSHGGTALCFAVAGILPAIAAMLSGADETLADQPEPGYGYHDAAPGTGSF